MTAERRVHRSKSMPSSPWAKSTRKMRPTWFAVLTVAVLNGEAAISTTPAHAKDPSGIVSIQITPEQFTIRGSRDRLQILVTGMNEVGQPFDLTHLAEYTIANPALADVDSQGVVLPKADGRTTIEIQYGNRSGQLALETIGIPVHQPVSFDYHALPILAQAGCSGGACHGSPHGKAGFRLSLFASDRELDRVSITRELFGRRINPIEPEKSLLLKKPTMQIAHQGGKRFDVEDLQYQLLRDWIAEGGKTKNLMAECLGIEVSPSGGRLIKFPHVQQQLAVVAKFSDGSQRDVTHLAKYEASDPTVADVSRSGYVRGLDRGETAIIVRYLHFIDTPLLTFVRDIDGFQWNDAQPANFVDEDVYAKLKQLQYTPSERCSDHEFLRRVYLDTIGILPTEAEVTQFSADSSPDKRRQIVDRLLERPEYAKFGAQKWGDLLRISTKLIGTRSAHKFNRWLENSIATNKPYDQFSREILLATGSTRQHPAGNFYRSAGDTSDAMETSAQVFLGTRIQCAKCHNHPFERWTQENYYGLSAFFNRLQRSKTGNNEEVLLWSADTGEVNDPGTGNVAQPWVPVTGKLEPAETDRRHAFADWLTNNDNPLFARIEVNRIWTQLMGRGIVEPFDDFRDSNPPSNSELLDNLATEFVRSGFDRKHIIRIILNSNAYQASSATNEFNADDSKYFSHHLPRMLTAEQLVDALGYVTGKPQKFFGVPENTKATWLPAPDLQPHDLAKIGDIEFLKVFGQPERQSACECERSDDVSLGQALELLNGKLLAGMIRDPSNFIHSRREAKTEVAEIVRRLYLRAYCRLPSDAELKVQLDYVQQKGDLSVALEDICWAIVNRNEFLFQH